MCFTYVCVCGNDTQTFKKRAAEIADHAHNPRGAPGDFVQRLDEMELQRTDSLTYTGIWLMSDGSTVFRAARDSSRAMREWLGEAKKKSS